MSRFTKRRKIARQEKEEKQRLWDETIKKQNKSIENMIKAAEIIEKELFYDKQQIPQDSGGGIRDYGCTSDG